MLRELLSSDLGGNLELGVEDVIGLGLVPARVKTADAGRQVRSLVVRQFSGGDVDTVVDAINGLNELGIQLQPESANLGFIGDAEELGDDGLTVVLVD